MRICEIRDRKRLMDAAMGRVPCDLTVTNVQLVNVLTGEIYPAEVDILDGAIARVREEVQSAPMAAKAVYDGQGRYLLPGYIDAHMHVESTMMIPSQLARSIVPWGTTTVCTDPHEIANVLGVEGVRFMLADSQRAALRQYVLAPSCVPAVPGLELAGAVFGKDEVGEILDMPDVVGVAEVMDYMGVVNHSPRMEEIVEEGRSRGMLLQGHAPMASGGMLAAYLIGGPRTDHESCTTQEVREKLRSGMRVNLRASSIVDHLDDQVAALADMGNLERVSVCTDDVHAGDLLTRGHINHSVARLIACGMEAVQAIRLATINAATEYGFLDLGAIAPGYMADFQLVDKLDGGQPYAVFIRGELVAQEGRYVAKDAPREVLRPENSMHVADIIDASAFLLRTEARERVRVLVLRRTGQGIYRTGDWLVLPVRDGCVSLEGHPELQFICVVNRHGAGGRVIGVTEDFGLRDGALATTVSHDSHNFTVVYRDIHSAYACLQALCQAGGGMCAARDGQCFEVLPLPVAGLMSDRPCEELAPHVERMEAAMQSLCSKPFSLLDLAVYTLPVIPGMLITDLGLVDGSNQTFVQGMETIE